MLAKTKAIVINFTKYQEKGLIVNAYTESFGLLGIFIPSAYGSKKNFIAFFQPLNVLDLVIYYHASKNLNRLKEVDIVASNHNIQSDILKSSQAVFLADIIKQTIKEHEQNTALFLFLTDSINYLERQNINPDFHLLFLIKLSYYLGFKPAANVNNLPYFDLATGVFVSSPGFHSLNSFETVLWQKLLSKNVFINSNFSHQERKITLTNLVKYYQFHLSGFNEPKSLQVLQEVFKR